MLKTLTATAISAALVITSILPVSAMPLVPVTPPDNPVVKVDNSHWGAPRPMRYRHWHGYRGYRDYHPGYRRHSDGFWYPLAAFGIGAAIGGIIASQPRAPVMVAPAGNSHAAWCASRYRSYRAYDNTFQPYNGPRQVCVSPYM